MPVRQIEQRDDLAARLMLDAEGRWRRPTTATTPLKNATLAVLIRRTYIQYMKTQASMLQIRNRRVVDLAAKLAAIRHSTKTDAVLNALENELARIEGETSLAERLKPLQERIKPIQDRVMSRPATGLEADKAFYDDLSGDL